MDLTGKTFEELTALYQAGIITREEFIREYEQQKLENPSVSAPLEIEIIGGNSSGGVSWVLLAALFGILIYANSAKGNKKGSAEYA